MKIYKVNVYRVDHCCDIGKLVDPCTAIVKVRFFGLSIREALSNIPLERCHCDETIGNLSYRTYNTHGIVLGVDSRELNDLNLVTEEEFDEYVNEFEDSKIKRRIEQYEEVNIRKEENKRVKSKIKQQQKLRTAVGEN